MESSLCRPPIGLEHGDAQAPVIFWLAYYSENTPGVRATGNATAILGRKSEPEPDGLLRILPDCGGRTWIEEGFLAELRNSSSKSPRQPGSLISVPS